MHPESVVHQAHMAFLVSHLFDGLFVAFGPVHRVALFSDLCKKVPYEDLVILVIFHKQHLDYPIVNHKSPELL
jgi:hypothetical protein